MSDYFFEIAVATVIVAILGFLSVTVYTDHAQKMECMKQRGEFLRGTCFFRDQRPAQ
jgi:hypothetical protein